MGSMERPPSHWTVFGRFEEKRKRQMMEQGVKKLYEKIERSANPVLESKDFAKFSLQVGVLDVDDHNGRSSATAEPSFFNPLLESDLEKYSLIMTGEDVWDAPSQMEEYEECLKEFQNYRPILNAEYICSHFLWLLNVAKRHGIPEDERVYTNTLGMLTGWRHFQGTKQFCFDERFVDTLFPVFPGLAPESMLACLWYRMFDFKDKPHLMLGLKHNLHKEEKLLRTEVLAILAAMISRFGCKDFREHLVFPVMVFSFMGMNVRIIQAYYNGEELIIHQSRLMEFGEDKPDPTSILMRFLANTPSGNTNWLPKFEEKTMVGTLTKRFQKLRIRN